MKEVRDEMVKQGADMLIVTSPDEVAWLLNVRGNDVKTTPGGLLSVWIHFKDHHYFFVRPYLTSSFLLTLPISLFFTYLSSFP